MKQYEFSGRNLQDAIDKGLKELKLNQEDVDIKIISEGGLFSKAKIIIETDEKEIETVKKEDKKEEKQVKKDLKNEVKKPVKKGVKEAKKESKKESKKEEKQTPSKKVFSEVAVSFAKELMTKLCEDVELEVEENEKQVVIKASGNNAGNLIGYRGEGLRAIQYLTNVVALKQNSSKETKRIMVDVENYKERREEALKNLAERIAEKVIRTGRWQKLEPMNSYERLIIHTALADKEVTTKSRGEEPRRYLVIEPKK